MVLRLDVFARARAHLRTKLPFAAAVLAACSFTPSQAIVELRADPRIETLADEIRLEVRDGNNAIVFARSVYPQSADFVGFPLQLPINAKRGVASRRFEVRVEAVQTIRQGTTVTTETLAQNRLQAAFVAGQVSRFTLWLLSGCRCNLETERCVPDRDQDLVPECDPIDIIVDADAGLHEVGPDDIGVNDTAIDGARDVALVDTLQTTDATLDAAVDSSSACTLPNRLCMGACVSCPSDVRASGTLCQNNVCVLEGCASGYALNPERTACVTTVGWVRREVLTVTPPDFHFNFGQSLALDQSGLTLVVGESNYMGRGAGAVHIFRRATTNASFIGSASLQILEPQAPMTRFGASVGLSADGLFLVATTASNEVLYQRARTLDSFGAAVQSVPRDERSDAVVLSADARTLISGAHNTGLRFYTRSSTSANFSNTPTYTWMSTRAGSVALSSDALTLVVGDRYFGGNGLNTYTGQVRIYRRATADAFFVMGNLTQTITYTESESYFGASLALNGDATMLIVGAPESVNGPDPGSTRHGRVFVLTRPDAVSPFATPAAQVLLPDAAGRQFGSSLALRADGRELFVGDANLNSGGSVAVFTR